MGHQELGGIPIELEPEVTRLFDEPSRIAGSLRSRERVRLTSVALDRLHDPLGSLSRCQEDHDGVRWDVGQGGLDTLRVRITPALHAVDENVSTSGSERQS